MFGAYREIAGEQGIRLFREMQEALAWLALTEGADPQRFPTTDLPAKPA
jgi:hypothetical protein